MANVVKNPTGVGGFQKGQSGNPNGRPRLPADLAQARKENREHVERRLGALMRSKAEVEKILTAIATKEDVAPLDALLARMIKIAIDDGCIQRANFIFDRWIGKPEGFNAALLYPAPEPETHVEAPTEPEQVRDAVPTYLVEINEHGKFLRARPRQVLLADAQQVGAQSNGEHAAPNGDK